MIPPEPPDPDRTLPVGEDPALPAAGASGAAADDPTLPVGEAASPLRPVPTDGSLPERIGNYAIRGKLGEGGMGVVYEAEQQSPRRRVALKVVRGGGLVTDLSVKLFQREAETLGRLKHPGIAAIHESGRTEDGQHYFAMELVRGRELDEHLAGRGDLDREEIRYRLELFRKIADAVNYAHQRGVIHRDLKPSNVLVDEQGEPKILDFGLARITDADQDAVTTVTEVGLIKGTLRYMSPEQTRGNPADIDLRTDVYSLGLILYQMLAGRLPYDAGGKSSIVEAIRVISQEPPASFRAVERLAKLAGSDLETIVRKALEKEPEDRYQSAVAFGNDLERFLTNQPILARPPSTLYQMRKLIARNRLPTALVVAAVLMLVAVAATMVVLHDRAERARREAVAARDDVEAVADFQARMLSDLDAETIGRNLFATLRAQSAGTSEDPAAVTRFSDRLQRINPTDVALAVLDGDILTRAEEAVAEEFADRPAVRARLEESLGRTAFELGLYERAVPLLERSADAHRRVGDPARETMSLAALTRVYVYVADFEPAADVLARAKAAASVLSPDSDEVLKLLGTEGLLLQERQEWAAAEEVFGRLVERTRRVKGEDDPLTLAAREGQAYSWSYLSRYDEAEAVYTDIVAKARERLGPDDITTMNFVNNAGQNYVRMGRFDEALELYREGLEAGRRIQGSEHSETHVSVVNLGRLYTRTERYVEAEELGRDALRIAENALAPGSVPFAMSHALLGEALLGQGRPAEAEPHIRAAYDIFLRTFGPESGGSIVMAQHMVKILEAVGPANEISAWKERAAPASS